MPTKKSSVSIHPAFKLIQTQDDFFEFVHQKNGLRVIYHQIPGTNVITSNIVYKVGSKDELPGQTGLAHMLEHMLFKPTATDITHKRQSSIMELERNVGVEINASTWKDRTNYYCTAPVSFLKQILAIQADQMLNVVITDKNLKSERSTVLSEYDMYNSDPYFALEANVSAVALSAHPYRHETIGWRSDIDRYTATTLNEFYRQHYTPDNATLILVGDIEASEALTAINSAFGKIPKSKNLVHQLAIEPVQEGQRRTCVVRPTTTNLLSISTKSPAFGTKEWIICLVLFKILADGPDSILHRTLVDTGKVTAVDYRLYPTAEHFLASITCTLANNSSHSVIEKNILTKITALTAEDFKTPLKKTIAQICYAEPFSRDSSSSIAGELTEYIAIADWTVWCKTETLVKSVTIKELVTMRNQLFAVDGLTIGTFIGNQA